MLHRNLPNSKLNLQHSVDAQLEVGTKAKEEDGLPERNIFIKCVDGAEFLSLADWTHTISAYSSVRAEQEKYWIGWKRIRRAEQHTVNHSITSYSLPPHHP